MKIQDYSVKVAELENDIFETGDKSLILKYLNALTILRTYLSDLEVALYKGVESQRTWVNALSLQACWDSQDPVLLNTCKNYRMWKVLEKRMTLFLTLLNSPNINLHITEIQPWKED